MSILLPCNLKLKHHDFMAVVRGTFYRFDEGESNFVNILLSYGSFIDAFVCNFLLLTSSSSLGRPYTQTSCFSCPATFLLHALQTYFLFLATQYGPASLHVRSCGIEYQYGGRKTGYRT